MTEVSTPTAVATLFGVRRLGLIMAPDASDALEAEGVLNPASARDARNNLLLFPRLVAKGNYSRIGKAAVQFDATGNPIGVGPRSIALAPERSYEHNQSGKSGVEDPRITYVKPLRLYVMTYVALTANGPRIALAVSRTLAHWRRLGLIHFEHERGATLDLNRYDNKDGVIFPEVVRDPQGRSALAILHRLTADLPYQAGVATEPAHGMPPSIWVSYVPLTRLRWRGVGALTQVTQHTLIMGPGASWDNLKIGMGTPPIQTSFGWLALYHGIGLFEQQGGRFIYRAGAVIFDQDDPRKIVYRSPEPLLSPETPEELRGTIEHVVFPTAIDPRENGRVDFYYGMADTRIGAATMQLPATLPNAGT